MSITISNYQISEIYYENKPISEVYYGNSLIFSGKVLITINPTPADATVTINGITTNSLLVKKGTRVAYYVSKDNYITKTSSFIATTDTVLNITLSKIQYTFKINPTPSYATVTMNGKTTKSLTVDPGTLVNWNVSYSGYFSQSGSEVINSSLTKSVTLTSRTTTIATSSMTTTQVNSVRITGGPYSYTAKSYRMPYNFVKGKSYTVKYTVSNGCCEASADTSTSTSINTTTSVNGGRPSTITQTIFNQIYDVSDGTTANTTINKTFTASANASYLIISNKGRTYIPNIGSVTITNNS